MLCWVYQAGFSCVCACVIMQWCGSFCVCLKLGFRDSSSSQLHNFINFNTRLLFFLIENILVLRLLSNWQEQNGTTS